MSDVPEWVWGAQPFHDRLKAASLDMGFVPNRINLTFVQLIAAKPEKLWTFEVDFHLAQIVVGEKSNRIPFFHMSQIHFDESIRNIPRPENGLYHINGVVLQRHENTLYVAVDAETTSHKWKGF